MPFSRFFTIPRAICSICSRRVGQSGPTRFESLSNTEWQLKWCKLQRKADQQLRSYARLCVTGHYDFVTICTFWKLTLITLNSLWYNFGHVLMIEICSVLSGRGCWRMQYTIYENRPHRRHFTVHCLQWSITFLTEYRTRDTVILSRQRTTQALINLRGCAGWPAPLLFAYGINRFLMTWLIP